MITYSFKTTSILFIFIRIIFALFISITFFALVLSVGNIHKITNEFLFLAIFLLVTYLILFLTKKLIIININASFIDKDKIEIEFKHLFFRKRKYIFSISEIKSYLYEQGNGYKVFYLKRKKGRNFKVLIFTETENLESFDNFYNNLKSEVDNHNNLNALNLIHEKPTIYKTKVGMFYGIIISISLIIIPICYIIFKTKINIGYILILYPAGILFLLRLYIERKK